MKISTNIITTILIIIIALLVIYIKYPVFFSKSQGNEFRNLTLKGKVVDKIINKENFEKTHTIILSDKSKYTLPRMDLDKDIDIGDSIIKSNGTYEIIIYKKCNVNDKIIYSLPFTE